MSKFASPSELREFALETAAQLRADGQTGAGEVLAAAATYVTGSGWEWLGELDAATAKIRQQFKVSEMAATRLARIRKAATSRRPYG